MSPRLLLLCGICVVAFFLKSADSSCSGNLGCYADVSDARALPHWLGFVDNAQQCIDNCKMGNFKYAGIQAGYGCRCGADYDRYGLATNCNKKCKSGQECGGFSANTVYNTDTQYGGSLGCFKDDPSSRVLPHWLGPADSTEQCIVKCKMGKYKYAGIQDGYGCRCGTDYAKYGPDTSCNKTCNSGEICGGFSSNTVYSTTTCGGVLGCFKDIPDDRALHRWFGVVDNAQQCVDKCNMGYHKYAGIQDGYGCWCGTDYKKYGVANNCNKKCKSGQICGGFSANTVYNVIPIPTIK